MTASTTTSAGTAERRGVCRLVPLEHHQDERGILSVLEPEQALGFVVRRVYYLHGLEAGASRGGHAHRRLEQFVIAVHGSFTISLDDGFQTTEYRLDQPELGLYIGPMVWGELSDFSAGTVCLVLASEPFDEADYFRDHAEFLRMSRRRP
ncbi:MULTISPECIES: sugar 3,4-ketoisomerase [Kitasatospora]|uniref:FdtA/QdtA family cupin domain-containing protein n=1 Tax=Kitasatospora cystarginea TaxID=58350 RepID=A0ABP5RKJ1_9ACTN